MSLRSQDRLLVNASLYIYYKQTYFFMILILNLYDETPFRLTFTKSMVVQHYVLIIYYPIWAI